MHVACGFETITLEVHETIFAPSITYYRSSSSSILNYDTLKWTKQGGSMEWRRGVLTNVAYIPDNSLFHTTRIPSRMELFRYQDSTLPESLATMKVLNHLYMDNPCRVTEHNNYPPYSLKMTIIKILPDLCMTRRNKRRRGDSRVIATPPRLQYQSEI